MSASGPESGLPPSGGAWNSPAQAVSRASRAIFFIGSSIGSQPGARDHGDREPGKRVLEEVLVRAVVEEVLRLQVDPERPGRADAGAGVQEELAADERGLERVAGDRGG